MSTILRETQCSTMHCFNRAIVDILTVDGQWWILRENPSPFCNDCKIGKTPDMRKVEEIVKADSN